MSKMKKVHYSLGDLLKRKFRDKKLGFIKKYMEKRHLTDFSKVTVEEEQTKNWAVPILTARYDGDIIFQELPQDPFKPYERTYYVNDEI